MYWLELVGKLVLFVLLKASKQGNGHLFEGYSFITESAGGETDRYVTKHRETQRILTRNWAMFEVSITGSGLFIYVNL